MLGVPNPSEELSVLYLSAIQTVRGLLTFQLLGLGDLSGG